jgi:chromosome segregation ATPase
MASAGSKGLRTAALAVAALGGGGYGLYYANNASKVADLQKQQDALATKSYVASSKAKRCETTILDSEALVKVLQQQASVNTEAMKSLDQDLTAARQKVQQLEEQQKQKAAELKKLQADMQKAHQDAEQARQDIDKYKNEAKLAEKALTAMNEQIVEAKKLLNPLNHPYVQGLYKKR